MRKGVLLEMLLQNEYRSSRQYMDNLFVINSHTTKKYHVLDSQQHYANLTLLCGRGRGGGTVTVTK
jgi:hypothetical protein